MSLIQNDPLPPSLTELVDIHFYITTINHQVIHKFTFTILPKQKEQSIMIINLTVNDWLHLGLSFVGFDKRRRTACNATNASRFSSHYGITPRTCSAVFHDLQTFENEEGEYSQVNAKYFLLTMYWLKCYQVEPVLAAVFDINERTARRYIWHYIRRIQALKSSKVSIFNYLIKCF